MRPEDFSSTAPGRLIKAPHGHWAFVPDPLPPNLGLDPTTVKLLSTADHGLGQLAGIGRMLPNPHLLISPFLRREALLSSRIEGTIAGLDQLLLFEEDPRGIADAGDVQEVANYVAALQYGLSRLETLPVSLRLIKEIHEILLRHVRGADRRPGEFRHIPNFIGRPGQGIENARFVPPPVQEMTQALHDLERFIGSASDLPFLVELAIIHYQFEVIHPFVDGNGRIGRLLIPLLMCEREYLPQPLLYLSDYFERNRDAYMDHLLWVSQSGGWLPWIKFFLQGVLEQSGDAMNRSKLLLDLWQGYRTKMQAERASALVLQLIDDLFARPVITAPGTRKRFGVTSRTAQLMIEKLESAEILRETTGKSRNRVYVASEILDIVGSNPA